MCIRDSVSIYVYFPSEVVKPKTSSKYNVILMSESFSNISSYWSEHVYSISSCYSAVTVAFLHKKSVMREKSEKVTRFMFRRPNDPSIIDFRVRSLVYEKSPSATTLKIVAKTRLR